MISEAVVNGIVAAVGAIAVAWITYKSKIVEVLGAGTKSPGERVTTQEVREDKVSATIENSSVVEELRQQMEWMSTQMEKMQAELSELREARKADSKRLNQLSVAIYWYDTYATQLIAHIESGHPPPPPARPKVLESLRDLVSIDPDTI